MNKFFLLVLFVTITVFSGCSTKKVYEPEIVQEDWDKYGSKDLEIIGLGSNVARLKNDTVLSKNGILDIKIDKDSRLITQSDEWLITARLDGNLTLTNLKDTSIENTFALEKTIATANVKENILAVLFADSEMALYDINTKELILKEAGTKSFVVDARMVPPHFMNDLVFFSTLDGKVVIINVDLKKRLRTVIVSSEDNFNNIIYFNVIDNKIIAATGTKILSLAAKEIRVKYEIRNIVYDEESLFVTTKQGELISLTPDLEVKARIKFPFAHSLSIISYEDKIYLLEKEGYIIVVNKNLEDYTVHEVDIEDGYIFLDDKTFYLGDEYISVE